MPMCPTNSCCKAPHHCSALLVILPGADLAFASVGPGVHCTVVQSVLPGTASGRDSVQPWLPFGKGFGFVSRDKFRDQWSPADSMEASRYQPSKAACHCTLGQGLMLVEQADITFPAT